MWEKCIFTGFVAYQLRRARERGQELKAYVGSHVVSRVCMILFYTPATLCNAMQCSVILLLPQLSQLRRSKHLPSSYYNQPHRSQQQKNPPLSITLTTPPHMGKFQMKSNVPSSKL
jgi:hypothetical protein